LSDLASNNLYAGNLVEIEAITAIEEETNEIC